MGSTVAEGRREPTSGTEGPHTGEAASSRWFRRDWAADAIVVVVYLALGFVFFAPIWTAGGGSHLPAGGDQWRNVWFDQWTVRALSGGHNPLYSSYANYPGGVNVLLNAGAPLLSFLFSPITVLFGPVAAFNLSLTLALPLSAAAAYLLVRRVVGWRPAAFLGGLLYGFGPYEMAHGSGHVNLSFAPFIPLILICVYELVVRQQGRAWLWGVALGLLVVAQFFVSTELLFDTALMAVIAVAVAAIASPAGIRARLRYAATGIGTGAAVAIVLLAWPLWILVDGPAHVSGPVQPTAQAYRANLVAPVVPDSLQLLSVPRLNTAADHFSNGTAENGSYLGLPLVALLLAGLVWCRRRKVVLVAGLAGVAAFILSLGGSLSIHSPPVAGAAGRAVGRFPLPEALISRLSILQNLEPARFSLLVALFAAVTGALLMDRLRAAWVDRGVTAGSSAAGVCAIAVASLLPLLPAGLVPGVQADGTPAGFTAAAARVPEASAAVVFPFPSATFPDPILWQADSSLRFKMPGGSFFVPQGADRHVAFTPLLGYTHDSVTAEVFTYLAAGSDPDKSSATRSTIAAEWRAWDVHSVLAVPAASGSPDQALSFLMWLLGPPSAHVGSTYAWYGARPGG